MLKSYTYYHLENISHEELTDYLMLLHVEQRNRIARLRRDDDKKASIISWGRLYKILREEYGIENPVLSKNKYGKPYLHDTPIIHFNISHCPLGCGCVVSDSSVGFDIQDIRPYNPDIAQRCCSDNELAELGHAVDQSLLFTQMWVMKESFVKMTGYGISQGLKTTDTTLLRDNIPVYTQNDCCLAVASAADFPEVEICLI